MNPNDFYFLLNFSCSSSIQVKIPSTFMPPCFLLLYIALTHTSNRCLQSCNLFSNLSEISCVGRVPLPQHDSHMGQKKFHRKQILSSALDFKV